MTITKLILMLVCLVSIPLETKEAKVTPLFSKDLTEFPGKEGVMITVEYPPGSTDPIHRHNADATHLEPPSVRWLTALAEQDSRPGRKIIVFRQS